jgi:hypothetical protein
MKTIQSITGQGDMLYETCDENDEDCIMIHYKEKEKVKRKNKVRPQ